MNDHMAKFHAEKRLPCPHCDQRFGRKQFLTEHIRKNHELRQVVCKFCKKVYANYRTLSSHLLFVHEYRFSSNSDIIFAKDVDDNEGGNDQEGEDESSRFLCSSCPKVFATKEKLRDHTDRMHEEKTIECGTCGEKFSRERFLTVHIKNQHLQLKDVPCPHCTDILASEKSLYCHIRLKHKDKRFTCKFCYETFERKEELRGHMVEQHKELSVLSCETCGEEFELKKDFREHCLKVHNLRSYECRVCKLSFSVRQQLTQHLSMDHGIVEDTGSRSSFKVCCDVCGQEFSDAWHMKRHKVNNHAEPGAFYCKVCFNVFSSDETLKAHREAAHPQSKVECDHCGKELSSSWHLKRHVNTVHSGVTSEVSSPVLNPVSVSPGPPKVYPFHCQDCGKGFSSRYHLKRHSDTQHSAFRPFECQVCGMAYNRRDKIYAHIRSKHEGVRFQCEFCYQDFSKQCHLTRHMERQHCDSAHQCADCGLKFKDGNILEEHVLKFHPILEPECEILE